MIFASIGIFYIKGFKFQPDFCNGCHDVLMMSMSLSDIDNLNIHGADYWNQQKCGLAELAKVRP